jgi:transcriptional regulator with XRE-family HTH domain
VWTVSNTTATQRTLARLKRALQRHGITQLRVAQEAGVGKYHVCHVLAGRAVSRNVVNTAKRLLAEKTGFPDEHHEDDRVAG